VPHSARGAGRAAPRFPRQAANPDQPAGAAPSDQA
jgi:hypothetical protein